uniref:thioredoxin-dependent peroxiredoxin n=1 Tax=Catagonus wagneri TaxID=51154 RepID=A0A8C3VRG8_9CETA
MASGNMHIGEPALEFKGCDEGITYRGLLIINGKSILCQITINDLTERHSIDEALWLGQAFQYTDEHREVRPFGWKPGSDTIKPKVNNSKAYFPQHNYLGWQMRGKLGLLAPICAPI